MVSLAYFYNFKKISSYENCGIAMNGAVYMSFILQENIYTHPEGESGLGCEERGGKMVVLKKGVYKISYPDFGTNETSNSLEFNII